MEHSYPTSNQSNQQLQVPQHPQIPSQKSKKKTIIRVIVVAVVLVAASSFFYLYGNYKARQDYYTEADGTAYPADSVFVDGWASPEDFANWKGATFTIPQYDDIPLAFKRGIVKIFMDNNYFSKDTEELYFFTKIKDRAYRVVA